MQFSKRPREQRNPDNSIAILNHLLYLLHIQTSEKEMLGVDEVGKLIAGVKRWINSVSM